MSTTGRPEADTPAASVLADQLRAAEFVRLVAAQTGDGVAAAGTLAEALSACDVPFQTSVVGLPASAASETDADLTLALGRPSTNAATELGTGGQSASQTAYAVARELGAADPTLALAGAIASGRQIGSEMRGAAEDHGLDRRPGIAGPGVDPTEVLTHSTLVHAPFSGDRETAASAVADLDLTEPLDEGDRQHLASLVALTVAGDDAVTERGTVAVEQFLRPHVGGPFETVGGFADVLAATAREQPGLGLALALGGGDREQVLSAWRAHGRDAHANVRNASTGRYSGLFVAQCEAADTPPVGTIARLLCAYRSPEPVVLAVGEGIAEARSVVGDDEPHNVGATVREAATRVDGDGDGTAVRGRATFDVTPTEFVAAFREAL
jgi:hypothetical protein